MGAPESDSKKCARVCAGYGQDRKGSFVASRFAAAHAGHRTSRSFLTGDAVHGRQRHQRRRFVQGRRESTTEVFWQAWRTRRAGYLKAVSRGYRELMEIPREVMLANPG